MRTALKKLWNALARAGDGSALLIALIVLLVLTLLGLSLLLQSNTEYVIALNERDSTAALANAEAGLQLAKAVIRKTSGPNLTSLLVGPDGDPSTLNDNGVLSLRTVNPAIGSTGLNDDCSAGSLTCESTMSGIEVLDGKTYEVFRIGHDTDGVVPSGKSGWDGPRGLVYVRVEDNYDDAPALDSPWTDTDKRVTVHVISKYPIQVDANGVYTGPSRTVDLGTAGVSTRELLARFGPANSKPAIVTEGNMYLHGNLEVCGECGSVHADGVMTIGTNDVDICQDVTATGGGPYVDPSASVGGTTGYADFIDVPVANPFHANYVPTNEMFNTAGDTELSAYPQLQCNSANGTKYFALVGDGKDGRVYKAYWKSGSWNWELIDVLGDKQNTVLDDCGRVVWAGSIHAADSDANNPGDSGRTIDDGDDKEFYGFSYSKGGGSTPSCVAANDKSLGPTSSENDYVNAAAEKFLNLPNNVLLPAMGPPDSIADYDAAFVIGNNNHQWTINANDVWSPLYNSVIWIWGNLGISGGPTDLCSSADTPPCKTALPGEVWRATFISFGNIGTFGTPAYAPVRSDSKYPYYQYMLIAGRDIILNGNSGGLNKFCPQQCDAATVSRAGYSGMILAHEQIELQGSVTVNGLVKSEDAATCSTFANTGGMGIGGGGNMQVYYDCEHPPDNSTQSVRMLSWEEVQ